MSNPFKGLLYFFMVEVRRSLIVFWSILFGILVVSISFSYYLSVIEEGPMTFSLTGPIYVFFGIWGFLAVKEFIPFSIKLGATRKQIWLALGMFFLALSIIQALFASLLQEAVLLVNKAIRVDAFMFLHLAYFLDDRWYIRMMIDSMMFFFFFAFVLVIGLLFYKYGMIGGGIGLGLIGLTLLIGIAKGWLIDAVVELFSQVELTFFIQMFVVGFVLYLLSYLFIRRMTIVKTK